MYMPEDVQFWLDNFCDSFKEIFTACEEKYDCKSSQSDYGDGEFGISAKNFLFRVFFKDSKSLYLSPALPPQPCFLSLKKSESPSYSATFTFYHLLSPPSHCRGLQPQEVGRGWLTLGHPQECSPTFAKKQFDILKLCLLNKWVCMKVILTCFWAGPPFEDRRQTEKNQAARGTHRSWGPSPKNIFKNFFGEILFLFDILLLLPRRSHLLKRCSW